MKNDNQNYLISETEIPEPIIIKKEFKKKQTLTSTKSKTSSSRENNQSTISPNIRPLEERVIPITIQLLIDLYSGEYAHLSFNIESDLLLISSINFHQICLKYILDKEISNTISIVELRVQLKLIKLSSSLMSIKGKKVRRLKFIKTDLHLNIKTYLDSL